MSTLPGPAAHPGAAFAAAAHVRVRLPAQLRVLAGAPAEVTVPVEGLVTQRAVLDALERSHPVLRGTVRDRATAVRRAFIRFFVEETDLSDAAPDDPLPPAVAEGAEPFVIVGAMAGG
ncbi:MAG TPA: MoaD/ThiS family protein [Acidimicrobiales bacterium]|nr:MoaD/ThiS family protein [Acidimicrobiales bacterium]